MGVRRYSRDPNLRRWEEMFDHLQFRCTIYGDDVTVGDLTAHGIRKAEWLCRATECWHRSAPFNLDTLGSSLRVTKLRWKFVCSQCGTKRPMIELMSE
jgi:hypothetical protein